MPTIRYFDTSKVKSEFVELEVKYTKREFGGYYVCRADNGRQLGWVFKQSEFGAKPGSWDAYPSSSAFRGDSLDDEGDLLDHVDEWVVGTIGQARRVASEFESRADAAQQLLYYLADNRATALTGESSYYCTPWKSRA